jgi:hypothetical protein
LGLFFAVVFPGFVRSKLYLPVLTDEEDAAGFRFIPQVKTSFLSRDCFGAAAGPVVEEAARLNVGLMLGIEEEA